MDSLLNAMDVVLVANSLMFFRCINFLLNGLQLA